MVFAKNCILPINPSWNPVAVSLLSNFIACLDFLSPQWGLAMGQSETASFVTPASKKGPK